MKCTAVNIDTNSFKTFFVALTWVLLLEVYSDIWTTNQKKKIQFIYIHSFSKSTVIFKTAHHDKEMSAI